MKLKKLFLVTILALAIQYAFAYDFIQNDIAYNILADGKTLAVTYRGASYSSQPYKGIITIPSTVEYGGVSYTVTEIGREAFANCHNLTRVYFPQTLLSIGDLAFNYCNYLEGVNFPDGLLRIGRGAFRCCFSITRVYIPSSVTYIGLRAFEHCPRLKWFQVGKDNDIYASNDGGLLLTKDETTLVVFPSGAYSEDDSSNAAKRAPESDNATFVLPDNITKILSYAFSGTQGLKHVVLHKDVAAVGSNLFSWCDDLEDINVAPENTYITSIDGVLYSKSRTAILEYPNAKADEYTIPDGVTQIFHAFNLRNRIKHVTLPSSIKSIDSYSFYSCNLLNTINLPEGLTTIEDYAFSNSGINVITIPASVKSIGRNFISAKNCIRMLSETPDITLHENAFSDIETGVCKLIVPNGSKANYTQSAAWSGFSTILEESEIPVPNITIADLKDKYWQDDVNYATEITDDLIVRGIVTSSDQTANIYKSLYIADETGSLHFSLNQAKTFLDYPLGQEILVSLKGLNIGKYNGALMIGEPAYYESGKTWEITFMDYDKFKQHVQVFSQPDEEKVAPFVTTMEALGYDSQSVKFYSGRLVKFCGLRFKEADVYQPFSFSTGTTSRILTDDKGNELVVRNSGYASWCGEILPVGNGDVTGILSIYKPSYNAGVTWQLYLRDNNDCENFDGILPESETVVYLDEGFEDGKIPDGWKTVMVTGDKNWYVTSFNNNHYAAATGYKGIPPFDIWLITPALDITAADDKTLSFRTEVNAYGSTTSKFEVYVLNTNDPRTATVIEQLNPTLAVAPTSGYSGWVESGSVDLSKYNGIFFIGFRYNASEDNYFATWCLDDVKFNPDGGNVTPQPIAANRADLESLNHGTATGSYGTYTSASGWVADNSCVLKGGTENSSPTFQFIGFRNDSETEYAIAVCLNGKTTASGSLTSPLVKNGIKKLKFNYGLPFSNDKVSLQLQVLDKDLNVMWTEQLDNENAATKVAYTFEKEISDVTSDFYIRITNNCPQQSEVANKDRVAIWNLIWESAISGVDDLNTDDSNVTEIARYTLDGRMVSAPVPGINIVRYSNGITRKEVVR